MLLWLNTLYYNHWCRQMLNGIANITHLYRNMILFVYDWIGCIVLPRACVHLVVLIFNCINNALTTGFHSYFFLPPLVHPFVIISSNHMILPSLNFDNLTAYTFYYETLSTMSLCSVSAIKNFVSNFFTRFCPFENCYCGSSICLLYPISLYYLFHPTGSVRIFFGYHDALYLLRETEGRIYSSWMFMALI